MLTVTCGEESVEALSGGYTWEGCKVGDLTSAVIACGAHPLQCRDITPVLATADSSAVLTFGEAPVPDKLTITRYSTDDWDNMDAQGKVIDFAASVPPEIKLSAGKIYVINAEWNVTDGYGGSVEYSFCTE